MIVVVEKQSNQITVQKQVVLRVKILEFNLPAGITNTVYTAKGQIIVGSGDGTYIVFPPGADGEYLKFDSSEPGGVTTGVPTLEVEDTTNYAVNGGFDFAESMMDPTTLTAISDGGYGADQWKSYRENADLQYRRVDASGESSLTSPYYGEFKKITNAGKVLFSQPLEYLDTLKFRGKSVSFQIKIKSNSARTMKLAIIELQNAGVADTIPAVVSAYNADSTDPSLGANLATIGSPQACSVTTSWQTFTFAGTVPSNSKNLLLVIFSDADLAVNDTVSLAEGGLYYGSTLRSWNPRPIGMEMMLCQRHYFLLAKGDAKTVANGAAWSGTQVRGIVHFPVTMRTVPTLDSVSGVGYYTFSRNSGPDAFDSLTLNQPTENATQIINSTEIASTAGHAGTIQTSNAAAKVGFSARL